MTMVCQVCNHIKRLEIDKKLVAGFSFAGLAREYGLNAESLRRHKLEHLSRQLTQAFQKKEVAESLDLINRIESLLSKAEVIFNRNFAKERDGIALKALSESRATFELLAKIAAYLHEAKAAELRLIQQQDADNNTSTPQIDLSDLTDEELRLVESVGLKLRGHKPDTANPSGIKIDDFEPEEDVFEDDNVFEEEIKPKTKKHKRLKVELPEEPFEEPETVFEEPETEPEKVEDDLYRVQPIPKADFPSYRQIKTPRKTPKHQ